jgi:hypothetical protein
MHGRNAGPGKSRGPNADFVSQRSTIFLNEVKVVLLWIYNDRSWGLSRGIVDIFAWVNIRYTSRFRWAAAAACKTPAHASSEARGDQCTAAKFGHKLIGPIEFA